MAALSITQAIGRLAELTIAVKAEELRAMERAARIVEAEAKREIGEYQDAAGPFAAWAQLADSTLSDKEKQGYAPPDNPLLRTGDMRKSVGHAVGISGFGTAEAVVGSNSDVAVYQELGTRKMPPRSFLGGAAFRKGEDVAREIGSGVVKALTGKGVVNGGLPIE